MTSYISKQKRLCPHFPLFKHLSRKMHLKISEEMFLWTRSRRHIQRTTSWRHESFGRWRRLYTLNVTTREAVKWIKWTVPVGSASPCVSATMSVLCRVLTRRLLTAQPQRLSVVGAQCFCSGASRLNGAQRDSAAISTRCWLLWQTVQTYIS